MSLLKMVVSQIEDEKHNNQIRYINGKFNDPEFNIDGGIKYDFGFFKGTLKQFDELKLKHQDIIHLLEWRYLTDEEIRLQNMKIRNFTSRWTKDKEARRYLRSDF